MAVLAAKAAIKIVLPDCMTDLLIVRFFVTSPVAVPFQFCSIWT
jgi:hypothetical protein